MNVKNLRANFESIFSNFFDTKEEMTSQFWLLSEEILKISRIDSALNPNYEITTEQLELFNSSCKRIKNNEPIQYILGKTNFYGNDFHVNESVLIPRPETEELVEWILLDNNNKRVNILDIATGSGCIAISLKQNNSISKVMALDISNKALTMARLNNKIVNNTVTFINADALNLNNYTELNKEKFEIIVSNPPYVMNKEKLEMRSNVLEFEPHLALFVEDSDPLIFYREIIKFAEESLTKNGSIYFEINQHLVKEMIELIKVSKFNNYKIKEDFRGNSRMMKIW